MPAVFGDLGSDLGYIWAHGSEVWINVIAILISGLVVWVVYAIFETFATRAKARLGSIPRFLDPDPCPACKAGRVVCPDCQGKTSISKKVQQSASCPKCAGKKELTVECPRCGGKKELSRRLNGVAQGISTLSRFSFFPFGTYEYVTVRVANRDRVEGTFAVQVTLGDPNRTTKTVSARIPPGNQRDLVAEFKVRSRESFSADFTLVGEMIVEPCSGCAARGTVVVPCPECGGKGEISKTVEVEEKCAKCAGEGSLRCPACNGTGKVR